MFTSRPIPIPVPVPVPVPRPAPKKIQRPIVMRASPKDDELGKKYCLKASLFLYKNTGPDDEPVGDMTAWDRNSDVVQTIEEVAMKFCRKHNLRPGETHLMFQLECEREIEDTVIVRMYDESDIQV